MGQVGWSGTRGWRSEILVFRKLIIIIFHARIDCNLMARGLRPSDFSHRRKQGDSRNQMNDLLLLTRINVHYLQLCIHLFINPCALLGGGLNQTTGGIINCDMGGEGSGYAPCTSNTPEEATTTKHSQTSEQTQTTKDVPTSTTTGEQIATSQVEQITTTKNQETSTTKKEETVTPKDEQTTTIIDEQTTTTTDEQTTTTKEEQTTTTTLAENPCKRAERTIGGQVCAKNAQCEATQRSYYCACLVNHFGNPANTSGPGCSPDMTTQQLVIPIKFKIRGVDFKEELGDKTTEAFIGAKVFYEKILDTFFFNKPGYIIGSARVVRFR